MALANNMLRLLIIPLFLVPQITLADIVESVPLTNRKAANSSKNISKVRLPVESKKKISIAERIRRLNVTLAKLYPNHPQLPIRVNKVKGELDRSGVILNQKLPKQSLEERLLLLSTATFTQWNVSDEGILTFNLWHRPDTY